MEENYINKAAQDIANSSVNESAISYYAENTFNPVQLHLLKMFSYAKTPSALEDIRKALSAYFAKRVEDDMDALWDSGEWDNEKNENILKEHLRTPYK